MIWYREDLLGALALQGQESVVGVIYTQVTC